MLSWPILFDLLNRVVTGLTMSSSHTTSSSNLSCRAPPHTTTGHCCCTWHAHNWATMTWFQVFLPKLTPPPNLVFVNTQPPHHFHACFPYQSPPITTVHFQFTQHAHNQVTTAQFHIVTQILPLTLYLWTCSLLVSVSLTCTHHIPLPLPYCLTWHIHNQAIMAQFQIFDPPPCICEYAALPFLCLLLLPTTFHHHCLCNGYGYQYYTCSWFSHIPLSTVVYIYLPRHFSPLTTTTIHYLGYFHNRKRSTCGN